MTTPAPSPPSDRFPQEVAPVERRSRKFYWLSGVVLAILAVTGLGCAWWFFPRAGKYHRGMTLTEAKAMLEPTDRKRMAWSWRSCDTWWEKSFITVVWIHAKSDGVTLHFNSYSRLISVAPYDPQSDPENVRRYPYGIEKKGPSK